MREKLILSLFIVAFFYKNLKAEFFNPCDFCEEGYTCTCQLWEEDNSAEMHVFKDGKSAYDIYYSDMDMDKMYVSGRKYEAENIITDFSVYKDKTIVSNIKNFQPSYEGFNVLGSYFIDVYGNEVQSVYDINGNLITAQDYLTSNVTLATNENGQYYSSIFTTNCSSGNCEETVYQDVWLDEQVEYLDYYCGEDPCRDVTVGLWTQVAYTKKCVNGVCSYSSACITGEQTNPGAENYGIEPETACKYYTGGTYSNEFNMLRGKTNADEEAEKSQNTTREKKKIYTVEEAERVSKKSGNKFMIRYK